MFALQTRDLSHIEFEQSENISNLPQGKYIEPSNTRHIDKKSARFALIKKGGSICKELSRLFTICRFYGIIQLIDKLEFDEVPYDNRKTNKIFVLSNW